VKYWEIIGDGLSAAGWSWGYVSFINSEGRKMFSVDAHRDDGKRYIVHSDELLSAFLELEAQVKRPSWQKAFPVSQ
jgi:putative heme iron utilization protein